MLARDLQNGAQQLVVVRVAFGDAKRVLERLELFRIALADGDEIRVGMALVNRNEFRAETETDDRNVDFFLGHGGVGKLRAER